MTKLRTTLLATTLLALPLVAQAQPVSGLYVGAGAGVNFQHQFNLTGTESDNSGRAKSRIGFVGLGSVGWGLGNGLRLEVEGNFRDNRLHSIQGAEGGGGRQSTYGVMGNVLFDFNGISPAFVPYVGAGVGYAWRRASNVHPAPFEEDKADSTKGAFAFQGIVGAAFPIAGVPGLALTAEYRYFGVLSTTYNNGESGESIKFGTSNNHSALLGIRYAFNAAPAAVMAAVVVAPAGKSFLVFFDWDRSTLTDRARGIIREAAATSKATAHTQIEVKGYADTSGNPRYNQGISMRRAQTVAAELVRNGVPKGEIAIKAFGDTVLLVPTGPGVREPQNRRVEIVIR